MLRRNSVFLSLVFLVIALLSTSCEPNIKIQPAQNFEWTAWGGTQHGERYSSLTQINAQNVKKLKVAWTFHTKDIDETSTSYAHLTFEATPLMFDNALFFNTAYGKVFSVDAQTGEQLWLHDAKVDKNLEYGGAVASRGLSLWVDDAALNEEVCKKRLLIGTLDSRLIALDAKNGRPCSAFGVDGTVNLLEGIDLSAPGMVGVTSPVVVFESTIVIGSSVGDFRGVDVERGLVRGYDVRTGELKWSWSPIPLSAEDEAWATWGDNSALRAGAGNAWAPLSVDEETGIVYVPTSSPGSSFYGGHRKGDNKYTSGIAALQAATGELMWFQQLVHHDVWDYDTPAQPVLVNIERDGALIPAVAQATKMGYLFVFDRRTGEPVYGIEERPMPKSDVPGELVSPTQPVPLAPPSLLDHSPIGRNDAWGLTPWDKRVCAQKLSGLRSEGIYTPPSIKGSLMKPGMAGGMNWGSVSVDESSQRLIVNVIDMPSFIRLIPKESEEAAESYHANPNEGESMAHDELVIPQQGTPYDISIGFVLSPFGVPCTAPPWGKLVAINLRTGEIAWETALGTTRDITPWYMPHLRLGVPNIGGSIITGSGLIFIGATLDDYIRAFDIQTGKELWKARLPAGGQATPMTYAVNGKQYVVIAAGGHGSLGTKQGDVVVAFALDGAID